MKRRAALTVIDQIFGCVTSWLAPILAFTAEEAWLASLTGAETAACISRPSRPCPQAWRDDALAAKWERVRDVRRVVTGALEIERAAKRIGSSLEAAPEIFITDAAALEATLEGIDLAEISHHQRRHGHRRGLAPAGAFTLPDVPGVGVVVPPRRGAEVRPFVAHHGQDVGSDPDYPDLSARDAAAVRELDALAAGHEDASRTAARTSRAGCGALFAARAPESPPRPSCVDQANKWWTLLRLPDLRRRAASRSRRSSIWSSSRTPASAIRCSTATSMNGRSFSLCSAMIASVALWVWLARGREQAG